MISHAMCSYLCAVYDLGKQLPFVHNIDIAIYLGVSKASVSKAVHKLVAEKYLVMNGKNIILSREGETLADIRHQHILHIQSFLQEKGLCDYDIEYYALQIAGVLDIDFFEKVKAGK